MAFSQAMASLKVLNLLDKQYGVQLCKANLKRFSIIFSLQKGKSITVVTRVLYKI